MSIQHTMDMTFEHMVFLCLGPNQKERSACPILSDPQHVGGLFHKTTPRSNIPKISRRYHEL